MKNVFWKIVAAGAAVVMAMIAAPTAQAATGYDRCNRGYFCIFEDLNGGGKYAAFKKGTSNLADPEVFGGYLNDKASSFWHNDDQTDGSGNIQWWCIYEHKDLGGAEYELAPNAKGNFGPFWINKVSSLRPKVFFNPPTGPSYYKCI